MTSKVSRGEIGEPPPVAGAASCTDVDWRPPSASAIAICWASCVRLLRSAAIWSSSCAEVVVGADALPGDELADAIAERCRTALAAPPTCSFALGEVLRLDGRDRVGRVALRERARRLRRGARDADADQRSVGDDAGRDARADVARASSSGSWRACWMKPPFVISTTNVLASAIDALIWSLYEMPGAARRLDPHQRAGLVDVLLQRRVRERVDAAEQRHDDDDPLAPAQHVRERLELVRPRQGLARRRREPCSPFIAEIPGTGSESSLPPSSTSPCAAPGASWWAGTAVRRGPRRAPPDSRA